MAGCLLGAGPDWELEGQSGLGAARLALNNRWLFERGLEGGVSFAAGERVDQHAHMRLGAGRAGAGGEPLVSGWRTGVDLRCNTAASGWSERRRCTLDEGKVVV